MLANVGPSTVVRGSYVVSPVVISRKLSKIRLRPVVTIKHYIEVGTADSVAAFPRRPPPWENILGSYKKYVFKY